MKRRIRQIGGRKQAQGDLALARGAGFGALRVFDELAMDGGRSLFVAKGGDASSHLESAVRIQGVAPSRVIVVGVPLGTVQELM